MGIYWTLWLVGGFGAPEIWALATGHPERTLSDWVWRVFDVVPGQTIWQWKAVHVLLAGFLLWAGLHLSTRIWR